jgi:hypothetical protein
VDQDSVAEIHLSLRLIVFLLIFQGNIFIIPEMVDLMDSQGAEVAEEVAAFHVDSTDPIEFSPARRFVCCAVRFGNGWDRGPSRIRGGENGVMSVLVVGGHIALP